MTRTSPAGVSGLFLERWSPRAFDGSKMPQDDLESMLDAARWAPSAFNYQPWRFLYAHRGDAHWDQFLDLLIPFNQSWAKDASALVFVLSHRTMGAPDKPSHSHSFDAGAASGYLMLQAHLLGYGAHGMSGIAFDRAVEELAVPDDLRVEAAIAIGRRGDPRHLPEGLRARETLSDRKPLAELAFAGPLPR
jgi:nitroreductase